MVDFDDELVLEKMDKFYSNDNKKEAIKTYILDNIYEILQKISNLTEREKFQLVSKAFEICVKENPKFDFLLYELLENRKC